MIELEHVTKTYPLGHGRNVILDDLSITLPHGANLGILGRNGAGKSTLMRIVAGVEMPDSGTIRHHGRVSWPVGFAGGFHGSLSGEENCRFVARIYGEDIDRVVDFAAAFAELGEYFYMPVRTYSSGMRARLAFGLSMAVDFDVYLVDEVTAVGDKFFKKKCRDAFAARRERSSVVMVSHSMETIREYCDQCAVLEAGKLTIYGSVDEAVQQYDPN